MKQDLSNFQPGSKKPDEEIPNFCPKCRVEYREGFTVCADCGVPLVHELPPEERKPEEWDESGVEPETPGSGDWVTLLEGADTSQMMVARSLLDSAGIPFIVKGELLQDLIEPGRIGVGYSIPAGPVRLQVQREDLEDARDALTVKEDEPWSEDRAEELEHKLFGEVAWFGGSCLAGFALAYILVPGEWDQPTRVMIYLAAAFCAGLVGGAIRKPREAVGAPGNEASYGGGDLAPASGKKRKYLLAAIVAAIALFVGYYHEIDGWARKKGPEGLSEREIKQNLRAYKKAIAEDPHHASNYFSVGSAYMMLNKPQEALPYLNKAIQLTPAYTDCLFNRALAHYQLGNYGQAIEDYSTVIELAPRYARIAETYSGRAAAYYADQEYSRAMDDYDKVIDLEPGKADAYVYRGRSYEEFTKDHKRAISYYDKALEIDPKNGAAYTSRGYARSELGQYAEALKDYETGISFGPKDPRLCNEFAWFLAACREGKYRDGKKAVEYARKALQLAEKDKRPELPDNYEALAAALAEAGNFEEAVKAQSKALSLYKPRSSNDPFQKELGQLLEAYKGKQTYAQWREKNPEPR